MGKDRKDFPEPLTQIADAPDAAQLLEFNAVLLKACAASREERYQSAEAMNADLALLQSGGSVRRQRKLAGQLRLVQRMVTLTALLVLPSPAAAQETRTATFGDDVRPLLRRYCAECHHAGGPGPFDELLSEAIEVREAGHEPPEFDLLRLVHEVTVSIAHAARRGVSHLAFILILLAVARFVPVAGPVLAAIGSGWVAAKCPEQASKRSSSVGKWR